jgi:hypothetical protein
VGDKRSTPSLNRTVSALAARQHGVVARRQLRELGLSEGAITAQAAAGRLHPVFHGTYAVGHGAISRRGEMLAAVMSCGEGAVVSHGSAAELLGLWERRGALIDVIAPNRLGRRIDGVRRRFVRPPGPRETGIHDGVPCTAPSRTIVDLAGILGRVRCGAWSSRPP